MHRLVPAALGQLSRFIQHTFLRGELSGNRDFKLFWTSAVIFTFGHEINALALPLTAVLLLEAGPAQMGQMIALGILPFALFSLPAGVLLDRRRKFPIILISDLATPLALLSVPLAWWLGWLSMPWMYAVAFATGIVNVIGGSAHQVFLTHLVGRDRLIDAHSKFAVTDSAAKLVGPGLGGLLVQWLSAPFALLATAVVFIIGWLNLRRMQARDPLPAPKESHPLHDIWDGLLMIRRHPLLWPLAWGFACWQLLFNGYAALTVLFASRELGLSAGMIGAVQTFGGLGVLLSSALIKPCTQRFGLGATVILGMAGTALVWLLLPLLQADMLGSPSVLVVVYGAMVFFFDLSVMLMIMPYMAMRQKVTPDDYLGRMTATMRFITVAAAPLGALGLGWLAEHAGLRIGIFCLGVAGVLLVLILLRFSSIPKARVD